MTKRKKTPSKTETDVLAKSKRRCCVCFGLDGDYTQKPGQIAHLDHDPSNVEFDNLAFLCLPHHAEYDSKMSQSKGLTIDEVKTYRTRLYEANDLPKKKHPARKPIERKPLLRTTDITKIQLEIEKIHKLMDQMESIGRDVQTTGDLALAEQRLERLSQNIQAVIAKRISQAEADRFYSTVYSPYGYGGHRGDPIKGFYENHIYPALSYLKSLIEAIEKGEVDLFFR